MRYKSNHNLTNCFFLLISRLHLRFKKSKKIFFNDFIFNLNCKPKKWYVLHVMNVTTTTTITDQKLYVLHVMNRVSNIRKHLKKKMTIEE